MSADIHQIDEGWCSVVSMYVRVCETCIGSRADSLLCAPAEASKLSAMSDILHEK